MWYIWRTGELHTRLWWGNLRERDHTHARADTHTHTHSHTHTFHGTLITSQRQYDVEQVINTPYIHNLQYKILETFYKNSIINHLYI